MSLTPLLPFFKWCDQTWWGEWVRDSTWVFPAIETFHILALTIFYGTLMIINLRLLGLGLRRQPVRELTATLAPYMWVSMTVVLTSGVMLFVSEALKSFGNDGFRVKMVLLFLALVFQFTVFRRVIASDEAQVPPLSAKLVALVSMTLWLGVGAAGRAIAFV